MSSIESARTLAKSLVKVASLAGLKAHACLTRMDEPLGAFIGNTLEVKESLYILKGEHPSEKHCKLAEPLKELCVDLSAEMAFLAGSTKNLEEAKTRAREYLQNGEALKKFYDMCEAQGAIQGWEQKLLAPTSVVEILSPQAGYLAKISSHTLGIVGLELGVGRKRMEDPVDPPAGFELLKGLGDFVEEGEPLLKVHLGQSQLTPALKTEILTAYDFDSKLSKHNSNFMIEGISVT
jgi:pyrimidine-nucleoside phosphorylase